MKSLKKKLRKDLEKNLLKKNKMKKILNITKIMKGRKLLINIYRFLAIL